MIGVEPTSEEPLSVAEKSAKPIFWTDVSIRHRDLGRYVFALLISIMRGVMLEIVSAVLEHNGWEAWHSVCHEQEPRADGARLKCFEDILEPTVTGLDEQELYTRWLAWKRQVKEYEVLLGNLLPQYMRVAIVRRRAPPDIKTHLEIHAADYKENYEAMHRVVEMFLKTRGVTRVVVEGERAFFVKASTRPQPRRGFAPPRLQSSASSTRTLPEGPECYGCG